MVTFTALVRIFSMNFSCNTKVAGLGEIFIQRKFSCILYINVSAYFIIILCHQVFDQVTATVLVVTVPVIVVILAMDSLVQVVTAYYNYYTHAKV